MLNPHINEAKIKRAIGQRLSLRKPQELSLDILSDVLGMMDFGTVTDVEALLRDIAAKYPSVESFEREFPSLCFCLLYTSPSPRDRTRSRMPSSA